MNIVKTIIAGSEESIDNTLNACVVGQPIMALVVDGESKTVDVMLPNDVIIRFFCDPNRPDPFHIAIPIAERPN